ncbi:MAG: Trp biosynthesis-associated membrane protein [Pseudoclavibacter caeni]
MTERAASFRSGSTRPGNGSAGHGTRRGGAVVAGLVVGALVALSVSQSWITWTVEPGGVEVTVKGQQAAAVVQAEGLTLLAVVAVMGLAGPVLARVLAVIELAVAGGALWAIRQVLVDPLDVSAAALGEATGVTGPHTLAGMVGDPAFSGWLWVAAVAAVLAALHAVWVLVAAGRWRRTVRRFQIPTAEAVRGPSPVGAIPAAQTWDALSVGLDPTVEAGDAEAAEEPAGGGDDPRDRR